LGTLIPRRAGLERLDISRVKELRRAFGLIPSLIPAAYAGDLFLKSRGSVPDVPKRAFLMARGSVPEIPTAVPDVPIDLLITACVASRGGVEH
jgi:hypothetical protein